MLYLFLGTIIWLAIIIKGEVKIYDSFDDLRLCFSNSC